MQYGLALKLTRGVQERAVYVDGYHLISHILRYSAVYAPPFASTISPFTLSHTEANEGL